jgi:hypothetical protein
LLHLHLPLLLPGHQRGQGTGPRKSICWCHSHGTGISRR